MDRSTAAKMVSEVSDWLETKAAEAFSRPPNGDGEVWQDAAEAASDLAHMITNLHRHLSTDA